MISMNKKAILSAIIISTLFASLVAGLQVDLVGANFIPLPSEPPKEPPTITIITPEKNNTIIAGNELNFTYSISIPASWKNYLAPVYSPIEESISSIGLFLDTGYLVNNENTILGNHSKIIQTLSEGNHTLIVYAYATVSYRPAGTDPLWYINYDATGSTTIYFEVDNTAPTINLSSPTNQTINQASIPLSFSINETTSQIFYSLDNQANTTLTGNTTLTALSEGTHNLVIYANDTVGNMGKSNLIFFTVNTAIPSPSPTSSPTQQPTLSPSPTEDNRQTENYTPTLIIIGLVTIAVVVGVIVYFKKRRK
jgi:hypothetical protein